LDGQFRKQIDTWVQPVGRSAKRAGISADVITAIGVVMAAACAVAIGLGNLPLGLLLLVLTGVPDLLDGAIAKASGTAHARGAFFDSVTDRLSDALIFGGVAWYFTGTSDGALPLLPFAVYASASVVSSSTSAAPIAPTAVSPSAMVKSGRVVKRGAKSGRASISVIASASMFGPLLPVSASLMFEAPAESVTVTVRTFQSLKGSVLVPLGPLCGKLNWTGGPSSTIRFATRVELEE